jgi:hypothetical protein
MTKRTANTGPGRKPDKLMRDALIVALKREAEDANGVHTKKLYLIADKLVEKALAGDIQAIKEINDRAGQSLAVIPPMTRVPQMVNAAPIGPAFNPKDPSVGELTGILFNETRGQSPGPGAPGMDAPMPGQVRILTLRDADRHGPWPGPWGRITMAGILTGRSSATPTLADESDKSLCVL